MSEQGKLVWIIGASSGIGESLVPLYADAGWRVVVSARNEHKLQALAQDNENIESVPVDVTDGTQVSNAIERFQERNELPDLTVFCSGIYYPGGIKTLTEELSVASMDTNYQGAVRVIAGLFPLLKKKGSGHIAVISSLSAYSGLPNAVCYGPTKAALNNLCESLKPEFDKAGLDLTTINPGYVKTPMTDQNKFPMPFIVTAEHAAQKIFKGLQKRKFEVFFPSFLGFVLKFLRILPYALYFPIAKRITKQ